MAKTFSLKAVLHLPKANGPYKTLAAIIEKKKPHIFSGHFSKAYRPWRRIIPSTFPKLSQIAQRSESARTIEMQWMDSESYSFSNCGWWDRDPSVIRYELCFWGVNSVIKLARAGKDREEDQRTEWKQGDNKGGSGWSQAGFCPGSSWLGFTTAEKEGIGN